MNWTNRVTKLAAIGLLCAAGTAFAADRLNTTYTYSEPSEGDFEDEVAQHEGKASVLLPVLTKEDYGFGLKVGGAVQANIWTFDNDEVDDFDLYKVKVPVVGSFQATEDIPLDVSLVPGIHSDFEDVDEDDFRLEGSVVGRYRYSETLRFVLGLAVGEEFGDPTVFPVGGVSWTATEALQLDLLFPSPKISYALSDALRVYVAGEPTGGQWNVGESDEVQVDIEQKGYRLGAGAEWQVIEAGWLFAMAGAEGGRSVSLAVDDDEIVDEEDVDDAMFVQLGFRLL